MTKRFIVATAEGMKSIPLSAMTPELWRSMTGGDASVGTPADYYRRVPWLYAGVNLIARSVASLPLRWTRGDDVIEDTTRLMPWLQSFGDLLDGLTGDLVLYGAAYVWLGRNARGNPTQLRRLLPSTITPKINATDGLSHFERRVNGALSTLSLEDVVYIWLPNRAGEIGPGVAPAQAALSASGALAAIDSTAENLFSNGAVRPTIAFIDDNMPDAELERVQSTIQRKLSGVKSALGFVAVSKKVEFATIGDPPDNLAMPELTATKREDVATALGVPQTLLFSQAANFATSQQDTLNFYDMTVIPHAMRQLSAFNSQLFSRYGIAVETAEDELELYQQMQGDQVQALSVMHAQRVITVNEFRDRAGFPPLVEPEAAQPPEGETVTVEALPEPDTPARAELRAWQRYQLKRLGSGKAARPFHSEHVPPVLAAALEGQLEGATDAGAIKAAFEDALIWAGYP